MPQDPTESEDQWANPVLRESDYLANTIGEIRCQIGNMIGYLADRGMLDGTCLAEFIKDICARSYTDQSLQAKSWSRDCMRLLIETHCLACFWLDDKKESRSIVIIMGYSVQWRRGLLEVSK